MQPLILLAAVSMIVLYVRIIVGCLCYVGAARASDVLIPPLLLNGYEHSLKSPTQQRGQ